MDKASKASFCFIDVYPRGWTPTDDDEDPPPQPAQTLYASLASSSSSSKNHQGRILSVGRKTGDVLLSKDKSVSGELLVVEISSTSLQYQSSSNKHQRPLEATTPEHVEACEADCQGHQLRVLLKIVGNLRTFLVHDLK
jgi:hypothetical protein